MEVNKSEKSTNETKTMDIIPDGVEVKRKSTVSFIHVFESDTQSNPEFKLTKKKTQWKNKFRNRKAKPRLLANKEADKTLWTPEMQLGYCKHSMRRFVSLRELQNPWDF